MRDESFICENCGKQVNTLNYTARSIPNVTDVGSTPTLGTPITVVTSVT